MLAIVLSGVEKKWFKYDNKNVNLFNIAPHFLTLCNIQLYLCKINIFELIHFSDRAHMKQTVEHKRKQKGAKPLLFSSASM